MGRRRRLRQGSWDLPHGEEQARSPSDRQLPGKSKLSAPVREVCTDPSLSSGRARTHLGSSALKLSTNDLPDVCHTSTHCRSCSYATTSVGNIGNPLRTRIDRSDLAADTGWTTARNPYTWGDGTVTAGKHHRPGAPNQRLGCHASIHGPRNRAHRSGVRRFLPDRQHGALRDLLREGGRG